MNISKPTQKFGVVKTILEGVYALTWVIALLSIIGVFVTMSIQEALFTSAAIVGSTVMLTTIVIICVCTIDSRNFLSQICNTGIYSELQEHPNERDNQSSGRENIEIRGEDHQPNSFGH